MFRVPTVVYMPLFYVRPLGASAVLGVDPKSKDVAPARGGLQPHGLHELRLAFLSQWAAANERKDDPNPYSKLARCIRVRFEFEADAEEAERKKMLVPWRLGQLSTNIILVGIRLTSQIMATKA